MELQTALGPSELLCPPLMVLFRYGNGPTLANWVITCMTNKVNSDYQRHNPCDRQLLNDCRQSFNRVANCYYLFALLYCTPKIQNIIVQNKIPKNSVLAFIQYNQSFLFLLAALQYFSTGKFASFLLFDVFNLPPVV